ncbi:hypothetical protein Sjap_025534 [Stephania japonica]|uniref:F-box domain-containing protein n=1 Tax=Stephania japonica TaxID=461633 RepID=A0AAP0HEA4_9MAGN
MAKCSRSNLDSPPPMVLLDRISDLPNSILLHILSLLPFKSTATTSILSKRWTSLFQDFLIQTKHFDFGKDFANAQTQEQFIHKVNQYLQLHNGSKIHKFHLLFHPGIQNQVHADKWLEFAVERSVEELGFDFCGVTTAWDDLESEHLTLLDSFYLSNSHLTQLQLGQFEFHPPITFTGFPFLVSLYLRRVKITDGNLESVLMKCPLLTDLSLCQCSGLHLIKIFGPKEFLLERLFVGNCNEAYEIEVLAPNLKSFHFYGDLFYGYSFREISALEDVYLSSIGYECTEPEHNYIKILSSVSTVRILTVCTTPLMYITTAEEYFPEDLPVYLPNLEELQIVGSPLDEDYLSYFYGFFKHTVCPCLEKLFIEFCAKHNELSWQSHLKEGEAEELATSSFDNLKTIKITNFHGAEIEMRLVKFFLANLFH